MTALRIVRIVARLNIGGPAVHILNLAAALDRQRFPSRLVVGRPAADEGDMRYLAEQLGVETIELPALGRDLSLFRDLWTVLQLVRILRRIRPHIVETHTAKAGAVGRVAARCAGTPIVIHVFHGHVFHSYFGAWKTRLFLSIERLLARFTDRIIAISDSQRNDLVERFRIAPAKKVEVVPLGLNLDRFAGTDLESRRQLRRQWNFAPAAPVIGFVGRLTAIKNPSLLLAAAARVRESAPQARFVIVGDGELRAQLVQEAVSLGLEQVVVFAGWRQDIPAVYSAIDILALTSKNEGTPVSLIEAMAAGRAVAATNVGGVGDVVQHERTGLLTTSEDVRQLADALLRLISNPQLRTELARSGQREVFRRFRLERLVDDMERVYVSLAREKGIVA